MNVELRGAGKSYGRLEAMKPASLTLEPGRIVALLGTNGAGKTTLLRCLSGLVRPSAGTILYDGEPLTRDRLDLRRRIGFVPDFPVFLPEMSTIRHLGMVLRLYEADRRGIEDRLVKLLRDFDLLAAAEMPVGFLSRGQAFKAALIAMMAADPELWLLDEPFSSGMDPNGLLMFKQHAREAADRGRTILYSTQILEVAEGFADQVCVIHRGEVRAFDSLAGLRSRMGDKDSVLEELFRQLREEEAG